MSPHHPAHGHLRVFPDADALGREAAASFLELVDQSPVGQRFTVALSGGSTPGKMYDALVNRLRGRGNAATVFRKLSVFWSDERRVPLTDSSSNAGLALRRWLEPLGLGIRDCLPPAIHPTFPAASLPEELENTNPAAQRYTQEIAAAFDGAIQGCRFDLVLLGMGEEGHTASLFPHEPHLTDLRPAVVAVRAPAYITPLPRERISFNLPLINQAKRVWVLVTGAGKRERLAKVWSKPEMPDEMPIQGVDPGNGELVWWVSEDVL